MSTKKRSASTYLVYEELRKNPQSFKFFQAIRLLEKYYLAKGEKDIVGNIVQFKNSLSVKFSPSEIEELIWHKQSDLEQGGSKNSSEMSIEITPAFISLTGLNGALPRVYTEELISRELFYKDYSARGFLNIFTNRLVSLFYQAWKKYQLNVLYEQNQLTRIYSSQPYLGKGGKKYETKNNFIHSADVNSSVISINKYFLSFAGCYSNSVSSPLISEELDILEHSLIYYAGILGHKPVSINLLQNLLTDYFNMPIIIEQFVGEWHNLPDYDKTKIGKKNSCLGDNFMCGSRTWQRNTGLRMNIGPLSQEELLIFLPKNKAVKHLKRLISLMIGAYFDYEVCLILKKADICSASISSKNPKFQLGYNTFLLTKPAQKNSYDLCFKFEL